MKLKRGIQQLWILLITITIVFPYQNKFSYLNNSSGGKISLSHEPKLSDITGGYTRLVQIGDGHSTETGFPELPEFTTYYQLDPSKTYDFEYEILDSYTIEDINILPHQGMEKWEVDAVSIVNMVVYNSNIPFGFSYLQVLSFF